MAAEGEEPDYESDPEDKLLPSAMRRREASDDEEDEGLDGEAKPARLDPRDGIGSDCESDGQGAAPAYEDEYFEAEEDEAEEEDELEEVVEVEEVTRGIAGGGGAGVGEVGVPVAEEYGGDCQKLLEETGDYQENNHVEEEEKKQNEPFAVPTAGAFYMHDDRFRENGGGRHRRTPGGRRLWESKDDQAWVHDRFEEMNLQDSHYGEERRTSKGRFRGRGKTRGTERGYARGDRSRGYDDRSRGYNDRSRGYDDRSRAYDDRSRGYDDRSRSSDNQNQNHAPKTVRGRGPRRYEPAPKNSSEMLATQNRQSGKTRDLTTNTTAGRQSSYTSNVQTDPVLPRKQVFASSLSSASPPFYPSGSSNQDISAKSERHTQTGFINRNLSSSVLENNFASSQSGALVRGRVTVDATGQDKRYMGDSAHPGSGKALANVQLSSSGSSISAQSSQPRVQGRGLTVAGQLSYQQTSSVYQAGRGSAQAQLSPFQQRPVQTPVQPVLRASAPQLVQRPGSGIQSSSPPQAQLTIFSEVGETESPPGSSKSKTSLAGNGKASAQESGRGSVLYSGAQVIGANGAMSLAHGDQNFPATPALLQVMQFGSQHHGGMRVPAVGMALPGYVAQPGFGNSEMTWVPMLAGAAGALGTSYGPYISLDGGYYARPSGQTASSSSSRETSTIKPVNVWKPPERPEIVNDEFGQRQSKPRRYSEMNFGQ